jgi:hypothetical protein
MGKAYNFKKPKWTPEELERLKTVIKECRGEPELIVKHFPNRSLSALKNTAQRYKLGTIKHRDVSKVYRPNGFNPNPVTPLTRTLVHNYYHENIKKGFSHDMAIKDVCTTLNRSEEQVKELLKQGL